MPKIDRIARGYSVISLRYSSLCGRYVTLQACLASLYTEAVVADSVAVLVTADGGYHCDVRRYMKQQIFLEV